MIYTIIPAKPFAASKTRLAGVLTPKQRVALSRSLLQRTISIARVIGPVAVVSRSTAVGRLADMQGAHFLPEEQTGLNTALTQGRAWAVKRGASGVLFLPLDLPHLAATELHALVERGLSRQPGLVIAPCRRGRGTNALLEIPPGLIEPHFGPDSFARHLAAADEQNLPVHVHHAPGLAFDLDTADDWQLLRSSRLMV